MSEQITQRESKNLRKIYHENGQFITILVLRISLICPSLHKQLRTGGKGCSLRVAGGRGRLGLELRLGLGLGGGFT